VKRREFISLLGGAAGWPLAARAQQGERMRRIGALAGGAGVTDADTQERNAAFAKSLQELGWVVGRNVQIDFRYGLGNAANIRKYAAELVALAPDVILVSGALALAPLLQVTRTVPIVFVSVADPVGAGSSRAWRGRVAMPPVSSSSNTV
jgi:ABC transporter substrate binding protein